MKILHISNFVQKQNGRLQWNHCFKINNGFIRNGHNVCSFSDRDMSRMNLINKINGNKDLNKKLINTFKNFYPDLVVLGHADKVHRDTLSEFKIINKEVKIIEWSVDHYYLNKTSQKLQLNSDFVDAFFITNADEKLNTCLTSRNSISFFPNIFDKSIENLTIYDNNYFKYDLFYALSYGVGTGKLRKKKSNYDREEILDYITKNIPQIKTNFYGYDGRQPVWGNQFEKELSNSLLSLNLSRKPHIKYYSSDRISQYMGNGSCVFIDINSGLNELFNDNEAVFFDSYDLDEFQRKILYYVENIQETRSIAKKGWEKGHSNYNERIVTEYFIDIAFNKFPTKEYSWPINQFFL